VLARLPDLGEGGSADSLLRELLDLGERRGAQLVDVVWIAAERDRFRRAVGSQSRLAPTDT
jgi:hypothetical protein